MKRGRYYLARVIKLGQLTRDSFLEALTVPKAITVGDSDWTITDILNRFDNGGGFVYGNLAKYSREGVVKLVDENSKQQFQALAPNLLEASAPFVYLPEFSGLAYLHVWNGIPQEIFPRRFASVIEAKFDGFFAKCDIEKIADYRAFLDRLAALERITELSAKVRPPNPLFGRLWKELDDYLRKRKASEVVVKESSDDTQGLATQITVHIGNILINRDYKPASPLDVTDAAVLMAADGYGSGKATGIENGSTVVIRTAESQKSFLFEKQPVAEALATTARDHFERLSSERDMRHPE